MSCGVVDSFSLMSMSPAVSSVIDIVSVWDENSETVSPSSLAGLELTTRTWLELRPAFAFPRLELEVCAAMPGSEHVFIECNSGVDLLGYSVYPPVTFYTPINLLGEFHLPIFGIAGLGYLSIPCGCTCYFSPFGECRFGERVYLVYSSRGCISSWGQGS